MTEPYIGEIRMFGGNFPPRDWEFCSGQLMSISENEALFNLIGTTYGGDGVTTFALPDLRSRAPVHQGPGHVLGQQGGAESVTLTSSQIPAHDHTMLASTNLATESSPAGNVPAQSTAADLYLEDVPTVDLNAQSVGPAGGSQPHENMQPYLCINFIIALFGVYPSPS